MSAVAMGGHAPDMPTAAAVMARAGGENFPVASRLLGRGAREHLLALYGFARLVDELGDTGAGGPRERLAALDWLEGELHNAYASQAGRAPRHPLLVHLQTTVHACGLPREPFMRLIEANRRDQRVTRYDTWEQLLGYCHLSADPVGELVLGVFGHATPERIALSDKICTALQLVEHLQDVAEDLRAGRIYLPAEDRARFGCAEEDLAAPRAGWRVRGLIAFEAARTRALLREGLPLLGTLHGRQRLAVAAFAAGGEAALEAIERGDFDVLAATLRSSRARRMLALVRISTRWRR